MLYLRRQTWKSSTARRRCIHSWPSLYPRHPVAISTERRRYIHGCEIFKKNAVAISTDIIVLKKKIEMPYDQFHVEVGHNPYIISNLNEVSHLWEERDG